MNATLELKTRQVGEVEASAFEDVARRYRSATRAYEDASLALAFIFGKDSPHREDLERREDRAWSAKVAAIAAMKAVVRQAGRRVVVDGWAYWPTPDGSDFYSDLDTDDIPF